MNNKTELDSELLLMHVTYKIKEGRRDEFVQKVEESGIIEASRREPGNLAYRYFYPVDGNNSVLLIESWTSTATQATHCKTDNFKKLTELKKEYVEEVIMQKYSASNII